MGLPNLQIAVALANSSVINIKGDLCPLRPCHEPRLVRKGLLSCPGWMQLLLLAFLGLPRLQPHPQHISVNRCRSKGIDAATTSSAYLSEMVQE